MDFLKKAQQSVGGNASGSAQQQEAATGGQQTTQGGNAASSNLDYGDKGLDFIEKKTGHTMGRDTNEKITDGARGLYEKATGKTVDPKWSN
ncbi:hypothetical protein B0J14DRAFT_130680 [Halenospora varia]|nr:hypothetical protein B0J14DRAFT_130680 [Halenospora varia]